MDRYVLRERRLGNPQANQIITFSSSSTGDNLTILEPENIFYGGYGPDLTNVQRTNNTGFILQNPGHIASGIDPRYLAAYSDTSSPYITAGQEDMQGDQNQINLETTHPVYLPYMNQNFVGAERSTTRKYVNTPQFSAKETPTHAVISKQSDVYRNTPVTMPFKQEKYHKLPKEPSNGQEHMKGDQNQINLETTHPVCLPYMNQNFVSAERSTTRKYVNTPQFAAKETPTHAVISKLSDVYRNTPVTMPFKQEKYHKLPKEPSNEQPKKTTDSVIVKNEAQNQQMSRFDRLKALNKSGPRSFSGPVEKVLKWHKALQEVGTLILYEIVAKCVSVRPGESCAKILVVRDESGPAMQVVYYEIDFLLPELRLPCMVRVIGRMLCGTCRLQAFHVRPATGDDVAILARRAAVAQHHVTKLCKEYIPIN